MVPGKGLEPSRFCNQRILSPQRLPVRHPGKEGGLFGVAGFRWQWENNAVAQSGENGRWQEAGAVYQLEHVLMNKIG